MTPAELGAAVALGIVEGLTEFLPISSTGHLIVASHWLGFVGERAKTFQIFIQLGAILAVVWLYRARFLSVARTLAREPASRRFATNLLLGFAPAAIVGASSYHIIKAHLFTPVVVAAAFIAGGILILLIERWRPVATVTDAADIEPRRALGIGLAQILALVPGISRSGATIMGGYVLGLSRTTATEFSFFLAVPVMAAAVAFDLVRSLHLLNAGDIPLFAVGFLVSFLSALVVIRSLLRYVAHHSFAVFAWYRIAFGLFLLWVTRRDFFTLG
ncbi:MAG: undecaprenyl-diphosphate phosphatase [Gemmatimonadota bacterium]|nr:undecaprenyl-diphosphate phosphatase [Gemmatimonadota bacterium]MDH5282465.1 undecaprenyl-diphosphate phosphatase [Gemmatimonadota bacterium]